MSHSALDNCIAGTSLDPVAMSITRYTYHSVPIACADQHVLQDGECKAVDAKYENCLIPDFTDTVNFTCVKCSPGFYINSAKHCEKNFEVTLPENCDQSASNNDCALCKEGFSNTKFHSKQRLICESGIFITNCLVYDTARQGHCAVCAHGFLPGDKTCEPVASAPSTSLVTNCTTYEYDRCNQCATGFVRTLDGKECVEVAGLDTNKTDIKTGAVNLVTSGSDREDCRVFDKESELCVICGQFSVHETLNIADPSQPKYEMYKTFDEATSEHKTATIAPLVSCQTTEPTPATPGLVTRRSNFLVDCGKLRQNLSLSSNKRRHES